MLKDLIHYFIELGQLSSSYSQRSFEWIALSTQIAHVYKIYFDYSPIFCPKDDDIFTTSLLLLGDAAIAFSPTLAAMTRVKVNFSTFATRHTLVFGGEKVSF